MDEARRHIGYDEVHTKIRMAWEHYHPEIIPELMKWLLGFLDIRIREWDGPEAGAETPRGLAPTQVRLLPIAVQSDCLDQFA
jgi:hypothetical protein